MNSHSDGYDVLDKTSNTRAYFKQLRLRFRIGLLMSFIVPAWPGNKSIDSAVECTKGGAFSYLQKPCSLEELLDSLKNAYKKKVMNRKKIEEKKMDELLKISLSSSPREILRKLREIDNKD